MEGTVSGNIADALYDGTADLCIGYQPENTEELAVTPLFEEKFVVLVPDRLMKEHHLDRKLGRAPCPWTALRSCPLWCSIRRP